MNEEVNNVEEKRVTMKVGLNAVKHLGKNLYSNTAAALSEIVANSWDAYSDKIEIDISDKFDYIKVTDDGIGMNLKHLNEQFGIIGLDKNQDSVSIPSGKSKRKIMGQKGIGKLASFYIGNSINVITKRDAEDPIGFTMEYEKMVSISFGNYYPVQITDLSKYTFPRGHGTIIEINDIDAKIAHQTVNALKVRLARRFSILDEVEVELNGVRVTIEDRGYTKKVQYLWKYDKSDHTKFTNHTNVFERDFTTAHGNIHGWIGTVKTSGDIKDGVTGDNLNRIVLLVNGKVADEDLLMKINHKGISTGYIIGVIEADFLYELEKEIIISSRQGVDNNKDEVRELLRFLLEEIKEINRKWSLLRNQGAVKDAKKIFGINRWYAQLDDKDISKADKLFGVINNLRIDENKKKDFYLHSALAFENLKVKNNLELIDDVTSENVELLHKILSDVTEIQKTMFYDSMSTRITVIEKLIELNETNALEKEIQKYIYENLWLLNPVWDREEQESVYFETALKKAFEDIDKVIPEEDRNKRIDLYHKSPYRNHHVIIELKRPKVNDKFLKYHTQIMEYKNALIRVLEAHNKTVDTVECILLLGSLPKDYNIAGIKKDAIETLKSTKVRILLYNEIINDAYTMHKEFIENKVESSKLLTLLQSEDKKDEE